MTSTPHDRECGMPDANAPVRNDEAKHATLARLGHVSALGADPEPAVEPTAWNSPTHSPHSSTEHAATRCRWADPAESA